MFLSLLLNKDLKKNCMLLVLGYMLVGSLPCLMYRMNLVKVDSRRLSPQMVTPPTQETQTLLHPSENGKETY